ncbi:iron chelate uptake ABC transporter family permease subunit [Agreia sp. COWG]|uniref:FecCD family ABC transporter permease n=1 Tax=Agreia sp. COWG TaxID=2773266 RepID=UPI001925EBD5|nr:iron chelate uptake ABC transporter family permease subunit [Agreia sp. COWG]CAD5990522.1 iron-enterobactin transporter subunit; membrane component of ABC superfamily [Agreia sp. COWG]
MTDFGERSLPRGYIRFRMPGGTILLVHRRSAVVAALLLSVALAVAVIEISTGDYAITPAGALNALAGGGSDLDRFIVVDQRLPRAVAALLVGAALGASGAIFQSVSRNPLGSPDIIGFTTGAATGGLTVILLVGASTATTILVGTLVGGFATAAVVIVLALRRGATGDRLVLSGIAVAAMLAATNDYLVSRADIQNAEVARAWQYGSLNAISWAPLLPLVIVLAFALPVALLASRSLRILELGDDTAAAVGLHLVRARTVALALGVCLAAIAVATAGPIGFLALAAPQLARRVARSPGVTVLASAAMGAAILVSADLLAQRLLSPFQIPVGLVTAAIGGAYLVWMLALAPASGSRSDAV